MRQLAEIATEGVRWHLLLGLATLNWTQEAALLDERDWTAQEEIDEAG